MTSFRRQNGSIVGSNIIPLSINPSSLSGLWDKNEQYSLVGANLWPSGKYSGLVLSYSFTSGAASVSFSNVTITGNAGSNTSVYTSGAGGTFTVTNNNGFCGGVNGGAGGSGRQPMSSGNGAGGGAPGGGVGTTATSGSTGASFTDVSGFLASYASAGYTAGASFGKGGNGSTSIGGVGNIPGGGGGGGGNNASGYTAGGLGAAGMILIKYTVYGVTSYQVINQASGNGSITFPVGTSYVKTWAIGQGGRGGQGDSDSTNGIYYTGAGGGGGGFAYGEFI
jgi:hypothetical protein